MVLAITLWHIFVSDVALSSTLSEVGRGLLGLGSKRSILSFQVSPLERKHTEEVLELSSLYKSGRVSQRKQECLPQTTPQLEGTCLKC